MATEFIPVLLGSDINAYSMARAFHEAYGIQSVVYGMYPASVCAGSTIIDYRVRAHNDRADTVLENVTEVASPAPPCPSTSRLRPEPYHRESSR